jgi:hypothetical protein
MIGFLLIKDSGGGETPQNIFPLLFVDFLHPPSRFVNFIVNYRMI